jgi:hypothetical protein
VGAPREKLRTCWRHMMARRVVSASSVLGTASILFSSQLVASCALAPAAVP